MKKEKTASEMEAQTLAEVKRQLIINKILNGYGK
jgi:hypothetical protein